MTPALGLQKLVGQTMHLICSACRCASWSYFSIDVVNGIQHIVKSASKQLLCFLLCEHCYFGLHLGLRHNLRKVSLYATAELVYMSDQRLLMGSKRLAMVRDIVKPAGVGL